MKQPSFVSEPAQLGSSRRIVESSRWLFGQCDSRMHWQGAASAPLNEAEQGASTANFAAFLGPCRSVRLCPRVSTPIGTNPRQLGETCLLFPLCIIEKGLSDLVFFILPLTSSCSLRSGRSLGICITLIEEKEKKRKKKKNLCWRVTPLLTRETYPEKRAEAAPQIRSLFRALAAYVAFGFDLY